MKHTRTTQKIARSRAKAGSPSSLLAKVSMLALCTFAAAFLVRCAVSKDTSAAVRVTTKVETVAPFQTQRTYDRSVKTTRVNKSDLGLLKAGKFSDL